MGGGGGGVEGTIHPYFFFLIVNALSGVVLLIKSRTEQQTAVRVLHANDPVRSSSSGSHGANYQETQVVVHLHPLRGIYLREKGQLLSF